MKIDSTQNDAFNYQLEILKIELQNISDIISRINDVTYKIKNWAIVLWAGSIALILGKSGTLNDYLVLTSILPIIFWFVDAWLRKAERSFIFRNIKISEFLNSEDFYNSFKEKKMKNFMLIDYRAKYYEDTDEYKQFTTIKSTFFFKELSILYFSMFSLSILLSLVII